MNTKYKVNKNVLFSKEYVGAYLLRLRDKKILVLNEDASVILDLLYKNKSPRKIKDSLQLSKIHLNAVINYLKKFDLIEEIDY